MINQLNKVRELNKTVNSKAEKFLEVSCSCLLFMVIAVGILFPFPLISLMLFIDDVSGNKVDGDSYLLIVFFSFISLALFSFYQYKLFPMFH